MNEVLFFVEKSIEGGYTARALDQFIFTEADDLEVLCRQVRNAVRCHFGEGKTPRIIRLHFTQASSASINNQYGCQLS